MTRIIGGSAGGRKLRTPAGDKTRPTADRVREAIFSAVEARSGTLAGLRFLDLYAGSGAVGLESLSRGAAAATLVEHDRRTAAVIRENSKALVLPAEVLSSTVTRALQEPPSFRYDVVFLDPPYSTSSQQIIEDLVDLRVNRWLTEDAVVVVERSTRDGELSWPEGFVGERSRRYGETTLWYGRATGSAVGSRPDAEPVV